jgi:hypothetical protein
MWLQLMDRDPQMAQMLNNPELLRESLQVMSNPVGSLLDSWHTTSVLAYMFGHKPSDPQINGPALFLGRAHTSSPRVATLHVQLFW